MTTVRLKQSAPSLTIRLASLADLPALTTLMEQSVRRLSVQDYTQQQVDSALAHLFGIDPLLISDGTYYVAEIDGQIVGSGGWSRRKTLYGVHRGQEATNPGEINLMKDAAKIRGVFVHPDFARRGIGRRIMEICEVAARQNGLHRLELLATLTGETLYRKCGFIELDTLELITPDGFVLRGIKMEKQLSPIFQKSS